jgi:proteasome lid subunit RPN8/RPN11
MKFSIAGIICRLCAPRHELSCSWWLWRRLLTGLRRRSRNATRESGAFLLGHRTNGRARIVDFVLYDDLDPHSLDTGIVRFDGRHFGALWDLCKRRNLTVVADVHTHPGSSQQSESDRAHPMVTRAGHLALIIPGFAKHPVRRTEVGMYRYLGGKRWETILSGWRRAFFHIGL